MLKGGCVIACFVTVSLEALGLRRSSEIKGKYVDLVVYTSKKDNKVYLSGVVKCPFTNKEFKLYVTPQTDQVRLGFVQHHGGFLDHILKTKGYEDWLRIRVEPYSRNSFHRRRYFVCVKCGYKSTRFMDTLLHLMRVHNFLVKIP
jgi:hypothetical protein